MVKNITGGLTTSKELLLRSHDVNNHKLHEHLGGLIGIRVVPWGFLKRCHRCLMGGQGCPMRGPGGPNFFSNEIMIKRLNQKFEEFNQDKNVVLPVMI